MDGPTDAELTAARKAIVALERLIKVLDKRDMRDYENPFHDLRMRIRNEAAILRLDLIDHNIYQHVVTGDDSFRDLEA